MKRKALAITLAAAMAMGTCAVTASAADETNIQSVSVSLYSTKLSTLRHRDSRMKSPKNWEKTQLPLTSRTHREIPTPVLQSLTASFPIMLT